MAAAGLSFLRPAGGEVPLPELELCQRQGGSLSRLPELQSRSSSAAVAAIRLQCAAAPAGGWITRGSGL